MEKDEITTAIIDAATNAPDEAALRRALEGAFERWGSWLTNPDSSYPDDDDDGDGDC